MSNTDLLRLIERQVKRRRERIRGKMVSDPYFVHVDPGGNRFKTLVGDVDVGSNRILKAVPIKANGKSRYYARALSPVFCERDARGRWQVIAPADRQIQGGFKRKWNRDTDAEVDVEVGFDVARADYLDYWGTIFDDAGTDKTRFELVAEGGRTDDYLALVVTPRS